MKVSLEKVYCEVLLESTPVEEKERTEGSAGGEVWS